MRILFQIIVWLLEVWSAIANLYYRLKSRTHQKMSIKKVLASDFYELIPMNI